jgi:AraC family transcriptional regulator
MSGRIKPEVLMPPHVPTLAQGEYLGIPRHAFAGEGIHVTENLYPPGSKLPRHRHRASNFCFLLAGGFRETALGRPRECVESEVLYRPPQEEHEQWFGPEGGRCLNVEFSLPFLNRYGDLLHPLRGRIEFNSADVFGLGCRLRTELRHADATTPLAVEGLVLEILGRSLRSHRDTGSSTPPSWLREAHHHLKTRFQDRLTLAELAGNVGVHPAHLARTFRRHYGTSVGSYLRRERLGWACRQILETRLPLHEIAYEAGYADQSHLTRAVRQATGLAPAAYRRRFGSARSKTLA